MTGSTPRESGSHGIGRSALLPGRRRERGAPRRLGPPESSLSERWTTLSATELFYRESPGPADAPVLVHLHGFGLSGRYLLPTAERLSGQFRNLVPDLPGFGRSGHAAYALDLVGLAHATAAFLDDQQIDSATLIGNSMGCATICEFVHLYPHRVERAVLVSPAGGVHNQPLARALGQLARDGIREPHGLLSVAVPDYLHFGAPSTAQLFRALTRYPTLDRLHELQIPTLVVIGDRDPLMPTPARLQEIATRRETPATLVVIEGAAHAINFSHPGELAHAIQSFLTDRPILDDPKSPGRARTYEIHRGLRPSPGSC